MSSLRAGPYPGQRSAPFSTFCRLDTEAPRLQTDTPSPPLRAVRSPGQRATGVAGRNPATGSAWRRGSDRGTRCSPVLAATGAAGKPAAPRRCTRVPKYNATERISPLRRKLGVTLLSCVKTKPFSPIYPQLVHNAWMNRLNPVFRMVDAGFGMASRCCNAPREIDFPQCGGYH